tara:strand:+ start:1628 stop:1945 length:318 start_codon:yes stop_codon:yes gene_type:complete
MSEIIIKKPILTEKMAILQERLNKYAFLVSIGSNKKKIKAEIENQFSVEVIKISTMNYNGKKKQMTVRSGGKTIRTSGRRANWKKAIVTLKKGDSIDFVRGEDIS